MKSFYEPASSKSTAKVVRRKRRYYAVRISHDWIELRSAINPLKAIVSELVRDRIRMAQTIYTGGIAKGNISLTMYTNARTGISAPPKDDVVELTKEVYMRLSRFIV